MNWKDIKTSIDNTFFVYNSMPIFNRKFIDILKFHTPGLAPVLDETGAYHIDSNGNPLYDVRYSRTFGFYQNRASVVDNDKWYHINEKGDRVYNREFKWTGNFQESFCAVRDNENQYFHIDLEGNNLYKEKYSYVGDYKEEIACVRLFNGLFKHIDSLGNYINDKSFIDLGVFHKNFATAKDTKGWFHIDKKGKALYNERYLLIEPFYNGQSLVTTFENRKQIIDEKGNVILIIA